MALPVVLAAGGIGAMVSRFLGGQAVRRAAPIAAGAIGLEAAQAVGRRALPGAFGAAPRRRRRKKRLTESDMLQLSWISSNLGKTAAAAALPFFLK